MDGFLHLKTNGSVEAAPVRSPKFSNGKRNAVQSFPMHSTTTDGTTRSGSEAEEARSTAAGLEGEEAGRRLPIQGVKMTKDMEVNLERGWAAV